MLLVPQLLCLLGLALGLGTVRAASPWAEEAEVKLERGSCPMFWYSFNGRCYKYVATHFSWLDSELNCLAQGANLVSIHSAGEHNFVRTLIQNFDPKEGWTWIGLSDVHGEGVWLWSDGSKVSYTIWHEGQPGGGTSQNCVVTNGHPKWGDLQCSYLATSVCALRTVSP